MADRILDTSSQPLNLFDDYKLSLGVLIESEMHTDTKQGLINFLKSLNDYEVVLIGDDSLLFDFDNLMNAYNNIIDAYQALLPTSESIGIGHITTDLLKEIIILIQSQLTEFGFTFEMEPVTEIIES